jgi:hypothetical protein
MIYFGTIEAYKTKNDEEYFKLVPSVRKFAEVLIELLRLGDIPISDMIEGEKQAYITKEIAFDLRKLLVNDITANYRFLNSENLIFYKDQISDNIEIRGRVPVIKKEITLVDVLDCPNIIMKIK